MEFNCSVILFRLQIFGILRA